MACFFASHSFARAKAPFQIFRYRGAESAALPRLPKNFSGMCFV
jgi:hypothetical protein